MYCQLYDLPAEGPDNKKGRGCDLHLLYRRTSISSTGARRAGVLFLRGDKFARG